MPTETLRQLTDALGSLIKRDIVRRAKDENIKPATLAEIAGAIRILHEIEREDRQRDLFQQARVEVVFVNSDKKEVETV